MVEVAVRFQPAPDPVWSSGESVSGVVIDWSRPVSAVLGHDSVDGGVKLRPPVLQPCRVAEDRARRADDRPGGLIADVDVVQLALVGEVCQLQPVPFELPTILPDTPTATQSVVSQHDTS